MKAKGVKSEAAKALGVSRKGLSDRLRRLGLESFGATTTAARRLHRSARRPWNRHPAGSARGS
jgi:hypothetical protein